MAVPGLGGRSGGTWLPLLELSFSAVHDFQGLPPEGQCFFFFFFCGVEVPLAHTHLCLFSYRCGIRVRAEIGIVQLVGRLVFIFTWFEKIEMFDIQL